MRKELNRFTFWVSNLVREGYRVHGTLVVEAHIRKTLESTLYDDLLKLCTVLNEESGARTASNHILGDTTLRDIVEKIPRTNEMLQQISGLETETVSKYGDRLLQTIRSTFKAYYREDNDTSNSAKRKRELATIEPSEAVNDLSIEPLSTENQEPAGVSEVIELDAYDQFGHDSALLPLSIKVARTSTVKSPCSSSVRSASKNLIAELSTMATSWKSTSHGDVQVSTNDANHGSGLLQEQRRKLAEFFEMSLEAIFQANWFDNVHEVVLKISDLATSPFEKRVLKDLLSRLVEFKNSTPESRSIVESSTIVETSSSKKQKQLEGSLLQRQNKLTFLDSEVSRIEEYQLKMEAEIQQLLARKDKLVREKNSALVEMEATNKEAARELEELKREHTEHEQASNNRLRAKEKLAQNNLSWKLFKENLGLGKEPALNGTAALKIMKKASRDLKMAAKEKFIWRIENFSTFTAETELHSPAFSLKGHQWKIRFVPKGFMGFMSAYLELDDSTTTAGVSSLAADFRLSLVNQVNRKFSLETIFSFDSIRVSHGAPTNIPAAFKEDSTLSGGGFKASAVWVPSMALASGGFLVDDTLVFEAQIRKSLRAMVYSNLLMLRTVLNEESGGKTEACPPIKDLFGFRDATLQDMSNRIPRTKAQLLLVYGIGKKTVAKYGDRLLQTIESTISDYYAEEGSESKGNDTSDSAKRKRECAAIEPSEAIDSAKRVSVCTIIEPSEAIDSAKRKRESAAIEPSEAIDSAKRVSVCTIIEPSEAIDSAKRKRESAAIEPSEAIDSAKRVSVCTIIEPSEAIDSAKRKRESAAIEPSEAIDSAKRVSVCAIIEPSEAIDSAQWKRESAAIEPSEAIDSANRVSVCAIIEPSEAIDSAKRKRESAAIEPSEAIDSAKRVSVCAIIEPSEAIDSAQWKRESAAIEPSEAIDSANRVSVCAIIEPSEAIDSAKRKRESAAIEPSEAIDSAKRVSVCAIIEPSEAIDSAQWKRESAAIEPSEAIDSAKRVSVCAIIEPSEAIDSAKRKRESAAIELFEAIDSAKSVSVCAIIEPSEAIDSAKKVARTSTIKSPCSSKVRSASKNLIAELSTIASSWKSTSVDDVKVSTSEANHGSALLQEQRGKLAEFFEMSLEAICQSNWFDSVHEVVLKISDLATDAFEKRILKDLLSRLVEFRSSTPESLSIVESSPMVETSNVHAKKQIEGSLLQRQNQLTFLESEVSRIEEDQLKVDAEIQQLLARKDKLVHEKNSALAEMEAANREASMELGDLERKQAEHERARDDLLRAKENLAQNNLSWKLFKENLGL
ncbi:ATP-dependent DNA helicase Q-like 4A [Linum perenne]